MKKSEIIKNLLEAVSNINKSLQVKNVLVKTMEHLEKALDVEASSIWEFDDERNELFFRLVRGDKSNSIKRKRLKVGDGIAGKTVISKKFRIINEPFKEPEWKPDFDRVSGFKTKNMIVGPLTVENKIIGVIQLMNKKEGVFTEKDIDYLKIVSSPISIALENAKLYEKQKDMMFNVSLALSLAIEKRDIYTGGHTKRVVEYSMMIAENIGYTVEKKDKLKMSAILHDIGKIAVPDSILNKKGKLTKRELDVMKTHPVVGANIISSMKDNLLEDVTDGILYHHENYDGSGYPYGIKEKNIPEFARIIAIGDSYDAMTTDRPYRKALSEKEAFNEIIIKAGKQFDPKFSEIFISVMSKKQ
jgi:putative nucleotidyltransferase with HDIG domain